MTTPELYQTFAAYNRWMNEKTYAVAAAMTDAERRQDRGAFFKSIHSTLNHILFGDRAWMNRLAQTNFDLKAIGEDLFDDFDALHAERAEMDAAIVDWTRTLTPEQLHSDLTWISGADGKSRTHPVWLLASHMFNHQTHHRGQITTLFSQMGKDVGPTDMPWMPR